MNSQIKIRKHLLDISERLFISNGYKGTTTRMIAESSGVNVAMINYYFYSKDNLLEMVISRIIKRLHSGINILRHRNDQCSAWQGMQNLVASTADLFWINPGLASFMFTSAKHLNKTKLHHKIRACMQAYVDYVRNMISLGQQENLYRKGIEVNIIVALLLSFRNHDILMSYSSDQKGSKIKEAEWKKFCFAIETAIAACLF